jgi:hypothetical protein
MTPTDTDALLRQMMGGDAEATALIAAKARSSDEAMLLAAAALLDPAAPSLLARATTAASTTRDRQAVAVTAAHLAGDRDRVDALARDHLADYPDSLFVAWIAAAGPPTHQPTAMPTPSDGNKEQS